MTDFLKSIDTRAFLFVNGRHNDALDHFFYFLSEKWVWLPLYALLLFLYAREYRQRLPVVLLVITLLIALSDQTASHLLKNTVMRLRPCHDEALAGRVHLVNGYCGGLYGFVSSHAANAFALATFFHGTLGERYRKLAIALFAWAFLIALSRVYLGVHYPGDVLGGAAVGTAYALVLRWLLKNRKIVPCDIPDIRNRPAKTDS
jgi:undecaprenyl-diphosphatase